MDKMVLLVLAIIIGGLWVLFKALNEYSERTQNAAIIRAGAQGEAIATARLQSILTPQDRLFTNVCINHNGRNAELDNVVVNRHGVFVMEVKNYSGTLEGTESMQEWTKRTVSRGGNVYVKTVRNPIGQMKRQVGILSKVLRDNGIKTWVEGYVYLVHENSPTESAYILEDTDAMDRAFHDSTQNRLSDREITRIEALLTRLLSEAA